MGVADLKATFNSVASPRYAATKAFLRYERHEGVEWQVLKFSGRGADGNGFEITSERLGPTTDVMVTALAVAQALLDKQEPLT